MIAGLAVFGATYLLIALQRLGVAQLSRPAASLLGALPSVANLIVPVTVSRCALLRRIFALTFNPRTG